MGEKSRSRQQFVTDQNSCPIAGELLPGRYEVAQDVSPQSPAILYLEGVWTSRRWAEMPENVCSRTVIVTGTPANPAILLTFHDGCATARGLIQACAVTHLLNKL